MQHPEGPPKPPAANTYQCPCGNSTHIVQGNPLGWLWIACTRCGRQTALADLLATAAKGPNSAWKAKAARMWAKKRGSQQW